MVWLLEVNGILVICTSRYSEFEHHVKTYGSPPGFGYKDFIPLFTAHEKFQGGGVGTDFNGWGATFSSS